MPTESSSSSEHSFAMVDDNNDVSEERVEDRSQSEIREELEYLVAEQKKNEANINRLKGLLENRNEKVAVRAWKWNGRDDILVVPYCLPWNRQRVQKVVYSAFSKILAFLDSNPFMDLRRGFTLSLTVILLFIIVITGVAFGIAIFSFALYVTSSIVAYPILLFVSCAILGKLYSMPNMLGYQRHRSVCSACSNCKSVEQKKIQ